MASSRFALPYIFKVKSDPPARSRSEHSISHASSILLYVFIGILINLFGIKKILVDLSLSFPGPFAYLEHIASIRAIDPRFIYNYICFKAIELD